MEIEVAEVNGTPMVLGREGGELVVVGGIEGGAKGVTGIRVIRNPEKPGHLARRPQGLSQNG
ncbi:hypothetical protein [Kitasatospora sp. NPDC059327]|uniref:hypothetical protein n=1 Tax=Kitasatospora sp. NPDC059327 TaxID=3346803 RepID=UPI0036C703FD